MITGELKNPPEKIKLKKDNNNINPIGNKEYEIINGYFNVGDCEKWRDSIDFDNSGFNSKSCISVQSKKEKLDDLVQMKIIVKKEEKKKDSGLQTGAIIGIVIAVVVVVAIIIIVIVIVIKKQKANKSNNEDDNGHDNDIL